MNQIDHLYSNDLPEFLLPYVLAIIINDKNQILLIYRSSTSWFSNHYGLIGGKIEVKESAKQAIIRELFEEVDLIVDPQNIEFAHVMHFMGETRPCVSFFFVIRTWQGNIKNKEDKKHDHVKWFSFDQLPENIIPRHRKALEYFLNHIPYSEVNW